MKRAARLNMFKDKYQEMTFENNQEIMELTQQTAYSMGMGPYYSVPSEKYEGKF